MKSPKIRNLYRRRIFGKGTENRLCGRPPQYAPAPCKLTFDLLTLKVVSESRVTWATSVPILIFLGLSVLDLGPMYVTDRQTSDAHHRLMPPTLGAGHNNAFTIHAERKRSKCMHLDRGNVHVIGQREFLNSVATSEYRKLMTERFYMVV